MRLIENIGLGAVDSFVLPTSEAFDSPVFGSARAATLADLQDQFAKLSTALSKVPDEDEFAAPLTQVVDTAKSRLRAIVGTVDSKYTRWVEVLGEEGVMSPLGLYISPKSPLAETPATPPAVTPMSSAERVETYRKPLVALFDEYLKVLDALVKQLTQILKNQAKSAKITVQAAKAAQERNIAQAQAAAGAKTAAIAKAAKAKLAAQAAAADLAAQAAAADLAAQAAAADLAARIAAGAKGPKGSKGDAMVSEIWVAGVPNWAVLAVAAAGLLGVIVIVGRK